MPMSSQAVRPSEPPRGLTTEEARRRLGQVGPNEIRRAEATSLWRMLAAQLASPLIWLLLAAAVISALLKEVPDAIAIAVIVLVNALVGFFQEHRAERALLALRSLTAPRARVLRDGRQTMVPAAEVVPGDLLLLESGDVVAADAHLLEAHSLSTNEASLTGESAPVEKATAPAPGDAPLAERYDSVFMGTAVAAGTGQAEVVATGMATELGKIAHLLATAQDTATPLQMRLARVSRTLLYLCVAIVAITASVGLLRGLSALDVFMSAVSLAVAAVPEGLPAIVTIALAIGVQRMAARHVLVRRLPAVETLGSATVICTDKTGTLTTGVMTVRELWGADHGQLVDAACACCDAELAADGRTGTGDPTEIALLVAGAERGLRKEDLERARPRRETNPFDPDRKRMSIRRADGVLYVKGAPDLLFPLCVAGSVGAGEANGVMITGDHPLTAAAIARELGIVRAGEDPAEVVHARATPQDKLRIVRAWKERGAVVAMTGDGVNDAPALREAHIGIAMGRTGTEVTREASDMVLTDDNFASIVAAVREGRGIFDNIRKTLVYLLAGNAGELLVMLVAAIAGLPLPLLPLHLLWINLATDGFPALALVMDPADEDVLRRPPRAPAEPMLGRREWTNIVWTGALQAAVTLSVFIWALRTRDLGEARNLAFTTLVFGELFRSFASRSATKVFWEVGAFTNLRLLGVVVVSAMVQIGIHHIPALEALFQIRDLPVGDCALTLLFGLIPVTALEVTKLARRLVSGAAGVAAHPAERRA